MPRKFVTGFNGARDRYEAPLALHEAGLLSRHVTDFYLPDAAASVARKYAPKALSRYRQGLPSGKTALSSEAALRQLPMFKEKLIKQNGFFAVDRAISLEALRIAEETDADLLMHQFYAYWAFERAQGRRKILFQLHPHAMAAYDLLKQDYELYPEMAWSFTKETDTTPPEQQPVEMMTEWKFADRIICASNFTKSSLVKLGANADNIAVAPYGADITRPFAANAPSSDKCRFIYVGQGVQRKGIHHLIKAWEKAGLKRSTLTVVCRLADPAIEPMAKAAGVEFIPGLSGPELDKLYDEAHVFAMPSMCEGFGLVYLEALSAGLHCIGTTRTGLPDLNLTDEAVTYVEAGNIEEIAASLADAETRWAQGGYDRASIAAMGRKRSWADHRREFVQAALT
jgi:glycosyltransferase involved in cell wall biosynthesis